MNPLYDFSSISHIVRNTGHGFPVTYPEIQHIFQQNKNQRQLLLNLLKQWSVLFSKATKLHFQKHLALSIPGHTALHLQLEGICCSKMHSFQALNFKMMWTVIKDKNVSVSNWQLLTLHLQETHEHTYMNTQLEYMPYIPTGEIFSSPFSPLSRIQTWLGNSIKKIWDIHRLLREN